MEIHNQHSSKRARPTVIMAGVFLFLGVLRLLAYAQAGSKTTILQKPAATQAGSAIKMFGPGNIQHLPGKIQLATPSSIPAMSAAEKLAVLGTTQPPAMTLTPAHPMEPNWATLEFYQPELVLPCCYAYLNPPGAVFLQLQAQAGRTYYFDVAVRVDSLEAGCKYTVDGPDRTQTEFGCTQDGKKGQHLIFGFTNSSKPGNATFVFKCSQPASLYSWEITAK